MVWLEVLRSGDRSAVRSLFEMSKAAFVAPRLHFTSGGVNLGELCVSERIMRDEPSGALPVRLLPCCEHHGPSLADGI